MDVQYMQEHFIKDSYVFYIDSSNRNRITNPHPNEHAIMFDEPFTNVFGIELLDAHVPTGEYMINERNNTIVIAISKEDQPLNMSELDWKICKISIGNYSLNNDLIDVIQTGISLQVQGKVVISYLSEDDPTKMMKFKFSSTKHEFIFDMRKSTMNTFLGFDEYAQEDHNDLYETVHLTTNDENEDRNYQLFKSKDKLIISPNIMYPHSSKYILLKCKEIEDHIFRSRSFQRNTPGLAKFNLSTQGDETNQRLDFTTVPVKDFHPIGKLTYLTLRFETSDGELYNFNGLNHTLTFVIRFYIQPNVLRFESSRLNPYYDPNFQNWANNNMYRLDNEIQENQVDMYSESDSDY